MTRTRTSSSRRSRSKARATPRPTGLPRSRSAVPDRPRELGVVEWFRVGERDRVLRVLSELRYLKIGRLRTVISWADWHTPEGQEWYSWLFPTLSGEAEILPCFTYTPPSRGLAPKTSAPPRVPKDFPDYLDQMITLFGDHFDSVELWNEPNNSRQWDVSLDPNWSIFSRMISGAAHWAKRRKKRTVLGGIRPVDPQWLNLMCERGVLEHIDAVGIHGFPLTYDLVWEGWDSCLRSVREVLDRHGSKAEIWITETGYSTWRYDERLQLSACVEAFEAPAQRIYWYGAHDLDAESADGNGSHTDGRSYHFGLMRADGTPKLLARLWAGGGLDAVRRAVGLDGPRLTSRRQRPVLITGGAGFIGTNLAHRLLASGRPVLLYDSLARPGVEQNLQWLRDIHGSRLRVEIADVRDAHALQAAVKQAAQIFHFAAQVAVTTSLASPVHDFEVNTRGTLNLLEAVRVLNDPPPLVFTSTNKVYGGLEDLELIKGSNHYRPRDRVIRARGIAEDRPLDFHSPYGCSKGAADQYMLDYARTFSIPALVFRMSCIYGPHQFGNEDQGWVAHFLIRALQSHPIRIYGDGRQVRDALFVEDLIDALLLAQENMNTLAGQAFNIGGGPENTLSLVELVDLIHELHGERPGVTFDEWRVGDQRYFVSDTRKFREACGWVPQIGVRQGMEILYHWLLDSTEPSYPEIPLQLGAPTYEVHAH